MTLDPLGSPTRATVAVFAGGGGGVGRSTAVAELARTLTRMGEEVLVVDAQAHGPSQWLRLGIAAPWPPTVVPSPQDPPATWEARIWRPKKGRPGLLTLGDVVLQGVPRWGQALLDEAHQWPVDWILVDAGSTPDPGALELFARADLPVLCASQEGPSLIAANAWLGHTARLVAADASLFDALGLHLALGAPIADFVEAQGGSEALTAWMACIEALRPWLLLLRTRDAAEREAGPLVAWAYGERTGIRPGALGVIDEDERRWFQVRQLQMQAPLHADGGIGVQSEEIARRMQLLRVGDLGEEGPLPPWKVKTPIQLLGLSEESSPQTVRRRHRSLWETLRRENPISAQLLSSESRESLLKRVQEAHRTLQPWLAQAAGGLRTTGLTPVLRKAHPGQRIREARQARGWSIRELSVRTRIHDRHLDAIESLRVDALPAGLHLTGYLQEVVRVLELDTGLVEAWMRAAQS